MKELFTIHVKVASPVLVGQDHKNGRRQLIPILSGEMSGIDPAGCTISGTVLPGGVDSQIIRPDGKCELSARYAVRLQDGRSLYIENNGIRTVPASYADQVLQGNFIDPSLYYFATTPRFEVYDPSLRWLEDHVFICKASRETELVHITYYMVE